MAREGETIKVFLFFTLRSDSVFWRIYQLRLASMKENMKSARVNNGRWCCCRNVCFPRMQPVAKRRRQCAIVQVITFGIWILCVQIFPALIVSSTYCHKYWIGSILYLSHCASHLMRCKLLASFYPSQPKYTHTHTFWTTLDARWIIRFFVPE